MPNKKSKKTLSNEQSGNAEFFRTEINQRFPEKFRAACLMVQGTSSDAGKSVLVTALCRWLRRRGVSVAPFKPQNMTLNSVQTADGGEIGVAQAVQALACGLAPHTDMNPVLLKPNSDTGSTVIIQGRAVAAMDAKTYHTYKPTARHAVLDSFWRLAAEYRVVLVEGAGSPAEINLRENDIANMGFAESVDSPVILVADIDRGGVFAQLAGTLALLSPTERDRVAGLIINRFRGDKDLLEPGLSWLEEYTGKPVLGVLPYLRDLHLDAEDSLSQNNARLTWAGLREGAAVDYPAWHETAAVDYPALREAAIERLADMVEEHLDMGILLKLLKI